MTLWLLRASCGVIGGLPCLLSQYAGNAMPNILFRLQRTPDSAVGLEWPVTSGSRMSRLQPLHYAYLPTHLTGAPAPKKPKEPKELEGGEAQCGSNFHSVVFLTFCSPLLFCSLLFFHFLPASPSPTT